MAARERLLIHTQASHWLGLTPLQTTFHRPLLNSVNFIPAQAKLVRHRLLAGDSKPVDRQSFKHRRESGSMAPPREASPHEDRVPDSCSVAAQRAESFDTDRCPNDAS